VENGGFGKAGPIASLMIEKYLRKKYKNRFRNKDSKTSLKEQYAKLGGMKEANAIETTPKDSISMWLTLPRL
jgi:penicillin-binding protein 2